MKRGKKYQEAIKKVEEGRLYEPAEAIALLKEFPSANFDQTVELHLRLGVDPRKADQQVRGTVILPHGIGKSVKVIVFAQGEKAKEAEESGVDEVGGEELAKKIQKGWLDFDVAIATPDLMSVVGKLGKVLGPKGLMPNPKSGTVTFEVGRAVKDAKTGKVEYRVDEYGIIHVVIGKVSFSKEKLVENFSSLLGEVMRDRPASVRGRYLRSVTISSTMGPAVKIDPVKSGDLVAQRAV